MSVCMSVIPLIIIFMINMRELIFPWSNGCRDKSRSSNYVPFVDMNMIYDWYHWSLRSFINECIPDSSVIKMS